MTIGSNSICLMVHPNLAAFDSTDQLLANSILFRELLLGVGTSSDLNDFLSGQFYTSVFLTIHKTWSMSPFLNTVLYVVLPSTKKEVVRIHTRWVVAVVANLHPFGDLGADVEFVDNMGDLNHFPI